MLIEMLVTAWLMNPGDPNQPTQPPTLPTHVTQGDGTRVACAPGTNYCWRE